MSNGLPQDENPGGLVVWDARRYLRSVGSLEVRLSRGFLRCRPEKWFPGLAGHWLPLIHSLGIELKIQEIKPVLTLPAGLSFGYCGSVDDEPFGVFGDHEGVRAILAAVGGAVVPQAGEVLAEYLARRLQFVGVRALCARRV